LSDMGRKRLLENRFISPLYREKWGAEK